jgi:hypothetical protein
METVISIVIVLIFMIAVRYFNNRICFTIGKTVLKILTLNKYPAKDPEEKQFSRSVTAGFITIFVIIALLALAKTHFYP